MMEDVMAKVIEFYVSDSLPKKSNYRACKERGKLSSVHRKEIRQTHTRSMASNVWFILHHSLQTLRAVEPATPREQCRKKGRRSQRGTSVRSTGSFVRPDLTFDFCERDGNYRLTVVAWRRVLCFPKYLATVLHIAPGI
jgi:hypothetical protein